MAALSRKLNLFSESEIGNRKNELADCRGASFFTTPGRAPPWPRLDQPESLVRFGGRAATLQQAAGRARTGRRRLNVVHVSQHL